MTLIARSDERRLVPLAILSHHAPNVDAPRWKRIRELHELAVIEYIGWFNRTRLHESIDDLPPAECSWPVLGGRVRRHPEGGWRRMPEQPSNVPDQATEAAQQVEPDDVSEAIETARDEELKDGDLREEIESGPEGSAVRASFEEAEPTEDEP